MHLNRTTVHVLEHFRDAPGTQTAPVGTMICKAGDSPDFVYILMEGHANILVGNTIVEVATRGTLLGEIALIDGKPRSATVVARTECKVLPIDAVRFDLLLREMPEFSRYVMNAMADRMRRVNDNLRAAQTVEGVNARVIANASLSMERTPRFRPSVRRQRVASLSNGNAAARAARERGTAMTGAVMRECRAPRGAERFIHASESLPRGPGFR